MLESLAKQVPFVSQPPALRPGGLESLAAPDEGGLPADGELRPSQRARAADLFIRGVLTPETYAEAGESVEGFERIVGRSNFLPAVFLEIGAATSRATCLIRTSGVDFLGRPGAWSGTGFLLSPNILLTNNHVLNTPQVAAAGSCVFNYQMDAQGQPMPTRTFRIRPDRLFLSSPARGGLDFTFVWVEGDPGREFNAVPINRRAFAIAEREFANIISHPQGRMKTIAIQENTVVAQDRLVVHYTSDTEPGSSGASVCNNNWQLVALHHASKETSPGTILNEGIKLSAIAAYIEQVAQSGGADAAKAREILALFGGADEELGFFGALGRESPQPGLEAVVRSYVGTEQDVDVGFWNVEWLTERYETKTPAVARIIREMNLDLWTLEESSPNAVRALVEELKNTYGLNYECAAAEPDSDDGKQSCTLLWNADTVSCQREKWGKPIEDWLKVDSRRFDDLGLEAVHGRVFDRYPALFRFTTKKPVNGENFSFYVVPLHLKAKDEGSLRREMASKILAAAIHKKIEQGADADWIIGGDYNAELATGDFNALLTGGFVPLSAEDERGGSFTYIKRPHQSLIDHIFLSPNLAERFGPSDYFIVAAEKEFPRYLRDISDHRPVLLRLKLGRGEERAAVGPGVGGLEGAGAADPALDELRQLIGSAGAVEGGDGSAVSEALEARRRRTGRAPIAGRGPDGLADREGYDADFLGRDDRRVSLPELGPEMVEMAAVVNPRAAGSARFVLPYTHFSVAMNGERRMAFYSAVNIDGKQLLRVPRGDAWNFDPRISEELQIGNDIYRNNDLDRGHLTRRLDPVWGPRDLAALADADTFFYTNACPQHKDLNQKEWNDLEDHVLGNTDVHDLKVCVFTGPIFGDGDRRYRGIQLPEEFWKVVVMLRSDTRKLSATGYILSQRDMITGFEFVFGKFRTYQVTVQEIERKTGLDFGKLRNSDPLARGRRGDGGLESTAGGFVKLIGGPGDLIL